MTNPFSLEHRAALVTGSSQGIGLAIAAALREAGARIVQHGLPPHPDNLLPGATYVSSDLTADDAAHRLIEGACSAEPGLDTLVCNAGSFFDVPFLDMTAELWEKTMKLNLRAAFFLTQAFARRLIARNAPGSIVIVSSTNGFQGEADSVAYDTSKGGLVMMTRSLAVSLAPHRIRVNGLAPGLIRTPLTEVWMQTRAHDLLPHYENSIPLARIGAPRDCAGAAVFLCSDSASYITGEIIVIDGGLTISQVGRM